MTEEQKNEFIIKFVDSLSDVEKTAYVVMHLKALDNDWLTYSTGNVTFDNKIYKRITKLDIKG